MVMCSLVRTFYELGLLCGLLCGYICVFYVAVSDMGGKESKGRLPSLAGEDNELLLCITIDNRQ